LCTICGGQIRIIAFITHSTAIGQILDHIRVQSETPHIAPARGPSFWDLVFGTFVYPPRHLPAALGVFEPERYPHNNEMGAL
jgi:hypothetical protein